MSTRYSDVVSAVVHVLEDKPKPLAALDNTGPDHADAAEGAEDEAAAQIDALHATNHTGSRSTITSAQASRRRQGTRVKTLRIDEMNVPGMSTLEIVRPSRDTEPMSPQSDH